MTDEPKKRNNSIFYWLGGFIVFGLLAIAGMFFYIKNKHFADDTTPANHTGPGKIAMAIEDYNRWVDALPDRRMNVDHELTSNGLSKIASVLSLIADSSTTSAKGDVRADIDTIKLMADSITHDRKSDRHADMIRKALIKISDAVAVLSKTKTSDFDTAYSELVKSTKEIEKKTLTLNQRDEVKTAFKRTGDALNYAGWKPDMR